MSKRKTPSDPVTPGQALQVGKIVADAIHGSALTKQLVTSILESGECRKLLGSKTCELLANLDRSREKSITPQKIDRSLGGVMHQVISVDIQSKWDGDFSPFAELGFKLGHLHGKRSMTLPSGWTTTKLDKGWTQLKDPQGRMRGEVGPGDCTITVAKGYTSSSRRPSVSLWTRYEKKIFFQRLGCTVDGYVLDRSADDQKIVFRVEPKRFFSRMEDNWYCGDPLWRLRRWMDNIRLQIKRACSSLPEFDAAREAVNSDLDTWLDANLPDHRDPLAYWD